MISKSSAIPISYIANTLLLKQESVKSIVVDCIERGKLNARIDDIDSVIYLKSVSNSEKTAEKALNLSKKVYVDTMEKLIL